MTSPLVPTPIVDKNGVSSTRLKKSEQSKMSSTPIPAPASPSESAVKAERKALTNLIVENVSDMFEVRRTDINKTRSELAERSTGFLRETAALLGERSKLAFGVGLQVLMATPEVRIRENIHYSALVHTDEGYPRDSELVEALRSYEQFSDCPDLTDVDAETQEQLAALMLVTAAYSKYGKLKRYPQDASDPLNTVRSSRNIRVEVLHDEAMVQFVMNYAADAERIVKIINDRGLTEVRDIQPILDWDTPSLAEGVI